MKTPKHCSISSFDQPSFATAICGVWSQSGPKTEVRIGQNRRVQALPDRIAIFGVIYPAIITVPEGLDGSGPMADDDRMVSDGESRFAADMMKPMTQAKLTP